MHQGYTSIPRAWLCKYNVFCKSAVTYAYNIAELINNHACHFFTMGRTRHTPCLPSHLFLCMCIPQATWVPAWEGADSAQDCCSVARPLPVGPKFRNFSHTRSPLHAQQQQFFPSLLGQRDARQDVGGRLQPKPVCAVCTPVPVPVPRLILAPGTCNWLGRPRQSSKNGPGTKICCYGWTCGDGHMLNGSLPCLRDSHTILMSPTAAGQWLLSPQHRASYSILPQRLLLCCIYHPIPFLQLTAAGSQTNYWMRRPESS